MPVCHSLELPRMSPFVSGVPLRLSVATGARVRAAFACALDDRRGTHVGELRAATLALVATLKAEGFPPEYALVALKQAIGLGGWWPTLIPVIAGAELAPREYAAYAEVFEWFLEGYFDLRRSG